MEKIKDTIASVMLELAKNNLSSDDTPEGWLKKILTKKELGHIKFRYFKKGVLGVAVDSSSWLYNFNLQKEGLLLKIKKVAGEVKDIRFSLGEIK